MKCSYCNGVAIGYDALGLPVCEKHLGEADDFIVKESTKGKMAATNGINVFPISYKDFFADNPEPYEEQL
jgi:hypothetical protein